MLSMRQSGDRAKNEHLKLRAPKGREGNRRWLARSGIESGVVLLGGSSVIDFRIRVAQARLRQDLLPSFWSMAGVLRGTMIDTIPDVRELPDVPRLNALRPIRVSEIDDPARFPNIAVIRFTEDRNAINRAVKRVSRERTLVDIPELIVAWLAYVWGVASQPNPLLEGKGLPSATLVRTAHAVAGIELMPGHSTGTSCPEAIWQAAKWWTSYYAQAEKAPATGTAAVCCPKGFYALRQPEARAID
jgi:hypothetical protein